MRATALGLGLAMLGGIGIAQAQVPPKPGADGGAQAGRPVLLLPLPNGGYAIAQQSDQANGPEAGSGPHGPGMPGMPGKPPRGGMQMMGGPMGREGMGHHGWMRRGEEQQGRGAIFAFRRGDANIFIRCAADEPTHACAAAASMLIDKVASMGRPRPPKGEPGRGPNSGVGMPAPGSSPPGSPPGTPPSGSSGSSSGSTPGSSSGSSSGSGTGSSSQ